MEPKVKWRRRDIVRCTCPASSTTHVHCPCIGCEYKAVGISTELRHWHQSNNGLEDHDCNNESQINNIEDGSVNTLNSSEYDLLLAEYQASFNNNNNNDNIEENDQSADDIDENINSDFSNCEPGIDDDDDGIMREENGNHSADDITENSETGSDNIEEM